LPYGSMALERNFPLRHHGFKWQNITRMTKFLNKGDMVCTSEHKRHPLEAIIAIIAGRESERGSNDQSVLHVEIRDDISPRNIVGRSLVCAGGSRMCACVCGKNLPFHHRHC